MNARHIICKKVNRLKRLRRRATAKEMPFEQRNNILARIESLQRELK